MLYGGSNDASNHKFGCGVMVWAMSLPLQDNVGFAFPPDNPCKETINKACHNCLFEFQTVRTTLPKGRPSTR
jgi:hypothetical protein